MILSMSELKEERKKISKFTTPIMPSQVPDIDIDLPKLGKYLLSKGISFDDLTEDEFKRFLIH